MADENTQQEETQDGNSGLEVTQDGATSKVTSDGTTPQEEPKTEARPEGLPEGFDSWEAFGKAQLEKQAAAEKEPAEEEGPDEIAQEVEAELEKLPEDSREKARPFFDEFARTGALSDESRKAAAEAFGVTEEMVDFYVKGAQSQAEEASQPLYEAAGGKEALYEFKAWAEANYDDAQKAAFNEALSKDPVAEVTARVAEWRAAGHGPAPRDLTKGVRQEAPQAAVEGYSSIEEQTRDISNPLYAKDPAFRALVEKRIAASNLDTARKVG